MKLTCQSEYGALKSVFIKNAEDAFINEEILAKEWKSLNFLSKPDLPSAFTEYQTFKNLLQGDGAELFPFPKDESLSIDSIYCRDVSIATDHGMILCNMGKRNRLKEPEAQRRAFEKLKIKILGSIQAPGTVEGGDVAWLDEKTLAVGLTYRTNKAGIEQLKYLLNPFNIEVMEVFLPHYQGPSNVFHLMSILSPVDKNLAVVYSPLMPIYFRNELLGRGYELVEVPEEEFESMGCNVLALSPRKCLMVWGNPKTKSALQNSGCTVLEYEGAEISVKGGGGPTCLTRPFQRQV